MRQPQAAKRFGRHARRETRADGRAEQNAAGSPARRQCTHQAAAALGGMLDQKHHRTRIFAANRKPLHDTQQDERDRREQGDRRVTR